MVRTGRQAGARLPGAPRVQWLTSLRVRTMSLRVETAWSWSILQYVDGGSRGADA